ncbi:MAG: 2-dehydro-3-deoxyphosphogluconate aldolase [Polyangiaceae bacterium]|nr:2-dehydro-3-deoxyphosphogluconate aldolase [Polyangiaceae bacterium]
MTPDQVVALLWEARATAILRTDDQRVAASAMDAAVRGGFRVVEVTLTTPGALELIRELASRPGLVVGAGTVLEIAQARAAVLAGARFLVSPVVDPAVIAEARALGVASLPGVHTPTEALTAHRAGAPLVKLFPAPAGGPAWVRSCLGPMPFLRIVPTNGVDATNAAAWLEAGAWAVGCVAALFDPGELRERRFERVEARARALLASVAAVPRPATPPVSAGGVR